MYTSPDEARSDLFLSVGVFLFGPIVVQLLLRIVPLQRVPVLGAVIVVLLPLLTTVTVPFLLLRYRGESLSDYGLGRFSSSGLLYGIGIAAPIAVATLLVGMLETQRPLSGLPLLLIGGQPIGVVVRFLSWLGVTLLAVYAMVKARDAFSSEYGTVRAEAERIGRVLGIVVLVTIALQAVLGFTLRFILLPVGVAAALWLVLRGLQGPSATSRATMLTPVLIFGLASFSFALLFSGQALVPGVWMAAMAAAIGLIIGVLQETRRSTFAAIGVALVVAGLSTLQLLRI